MTAAIAGVGYTPFTKESKRSVLDLATEACSSALDDAGMAAREVDGIASFMVMHDSVPCQAVATCLAIPELKVALDIDLGGQAPCYLVWLAATLIDAGAADATGVGTGAGFDFVAIATIPARSATPPRRDCAPAPGSSR